MLENAIKIMLMAVILSGCTTKDFYRSGGVPGIIVGAIILESEEIEKDPCSREHWDKRVACRKKIKDDVDDLARSMNRESDETKQ